MFFILLYGGYGTLTEKTKALRKKHALPVFADIKKLLDEASPKTTPKGLLGKAVNHALNNVSSG